MERKLTFMQVLSAIHRAKGLTYLRAMWNWLYAQRKEPLKLSDEYLAQGNMAKMWRLC